MSSIYTISPASLHDLRDPTDRMQQPHHTDSHPNHVHAVPITPVESNLLSPYSSHVRSNSASPAGNTYTPDTISTVDHYQSSDTFSNSDITDDLYFGVDFTNVDASSSFLGDAENTQMSTAHQVPTLQNDGTQYFTYPMSPDKTPSIPATSSFDSRKGPSTDLRGSVLTGNFSTQPGPPTKYSDSNYSALQLTPDTNGGSWSSDDGLAPAVPAMTTQSPRVTVSMWNADAPIQGIERSFTTGTEDSRKTLHAPHSIAGDLAGEPPRESLPSAPRNAQGSWLSNANSRRRGLAPGSRSNEEVPSPNQQAARRDRDNINEAVSTWVTQSAANPSNSSQAGAEGPYSNIHTTQRIDEDDDDDDDDDNIPSSEIPLGHTTENKHMPGQTYLKLDEPSGPINDVDLEIIRGFRNWGDGPMIHGIQVGNPSQPESSQAAIEKFNRQCQDNDSIISHAATWGTRRRSLPSIADVDGFMTGNIFKKLSISSHSRRPSFIKRFPSLVRKPSASQLLKRKGSNASEMTAEDVDDQGERRESKDSLAPPARSSSWGIGNMSKKPTPSLNTALFGMATSAAAIGTTHARSGSISATPITSPKSPFASLSVPPVKNALRRPRSKTELPRSSGFEPSSHPNLVGMLKKQGGPPVAQLARTRQVVDQDEDDDEDDDAMDEGDFKPESGKVDITPTSLGFQEHILRLNPGLRSSDGQPNPNSYLVERITYQMVTRYKQLLDQRVRHLNLVSKKSCPAGLMCVESGGSAIILDSRLGDRGIDPLSARPDSSDGDTTTLEGGINPESFPPGIPMPPTGSLPSEFECQLCFSNKKFQKPSDWTKHVHEDVQPFTCTWERCREPKMFKRKADWVRHENEGHRHLEWWGCDVEGCTHKCYRRDNFLQHLVREHKFAEPKIKTKAAIKKAGGVDHTWQKVEQCHHETDKMPMDEPCRFCGKTFLTFKKLTVHLAKHMEQISLPVLKLVAARDLDANTVISPIQEAPPRSFGYPSTPEVKQDPHEFNPQESHMTTTNPNSMDYHNPRSAMGYPNIATMPLQTSYYTQPPAPQQYNDISHNVGPSMMVPQPYNAQSPYPNMPVSTSSYDTSTTAYMNMPVQETEPFPAFNSLGIHDPTGGMGYDNLGNPIIQNMEPYGSNAGSVSPYSHSPHIGHDGTFYAPD